MNIIVSANLPGGHQADYVTTMKTLVPIVNDSVQTLFFKEQSGEDTEIMASEFLDSLSGENYRPSSPGYDPNGW